MKSAVPYLQWENPGLKNGYRGGVPCDERGDDLAINADTCQYSLRRPFLYLESIGSEQRRGRMFASADNHIKQKTMTHPISLRIYF